MDNTRKRYQPPHLRNRRNTEGNRNRSHSSCSVDDDFISQFESLQGPTRRRDQSEGSSLFKNWNSKNTNESDKYSKQVLGSNAQQNAKRSTVRRVPRGGKSDNFQSPNNLYGHTSASNEILFSKSTNMGRSRRDQINNDDFRRPFKKRGEMKVGFRYLESLLNKPLEEVMSKLMGNKGFFDLVERCEELSPDYIVLIVDLMSKFCECEFSTLRIQILQKCLCINFLKSLHMFISSIALQTNQDKKRNSYFWKDSDSFWSNLMKICKTILREMPQKYGDPLLKLSKLTSINLPQIESMHGIHINDEIKTDFNTFIQTADAIIAESKKKERKLTPINKDEGEPPNDFREISVYPTTMELISNEKPFLRKNVVKGPYRDVEHYLDVQFRLLREDFVGPLREGVCSYLERNKDGTKSRIQNVKIHQNVQFLQPITVTEHYCVLLKFSFTKKKTSYTYENSRRFMYGSLVCFTRDDFRTLIFGKIVDRDEKYLKNNELVIGFEEKEELIYNANYLMIECSVYFEPYYHVLTVMKHITDDDFPMRNYIIDVDPTPAQPRFISPTTVYRIEDCNNRVINWSPHSATDMRFSTFNLSQNLAFIAALTRRFSIIQGPPGTGKTYVGLKIATTLLKNKVHWYTRTPMLIICYTNHALDQFLEGLLRTTDRIIRVGGQSKNENLKRLNLSAQSRRHVDFESKHRLTCCLSDIKTITDTMDQIRRCDSIINFWALRKLIPDFENSWLANATKDDLLNWLLGVTKGDEIDFTVEQDGIPENINDMEAIEDDEYEEENDDMEGDIDDLLQLVDVKPEKPLLCLQELFGKIRFNINRLNELQEILQKDKNYDVIFEYTILERENENLEMVYKYVQEQLRMDRRGIHVDPNTLNAKNSKYLPLNDRWSLYFHWLNLYNDYLIRKHEAASREFRLAYKIYQEAKDLANIEILKNTLVIGMTTTGAARLHSSLQMIKCPIVIVEEAAEVLEAHIVTSLTKDCEQLILIGDHQQLKPSTSSYRIEKFFDLGISLFERMILNNVQCFTLNIQHRMRPEISSLIKPTIYPNLEDHENVFDRPNIKGVDKCLYFIDHNHPEEADNIGTTKKNMHEVKFLIQFANYLILNGYDPTNITILAAYLGQMYELKKEKSKNNLKDVKITVLDNYQGEENNIILLSLVRNNADNKIGFLSIENRVCVALSRARDGLYVMGNMSQLCENSKVWVEIKKTLMNQHAIGSALSLKCQNHNKITNVSNPEDFFMVAEGGCNQICQMLLPCGHNCKRLCHILDREHMENKCQEECGRRLCDSNPLHTCRKRCYEDCGPCNYQVTRLLNCDHEVIISCYIDITEYNCLIEVPAVLPCGHETTKPCSVEPEQHKCPFPCDTRLDCGHACIRNCHVRDDPDHIKYKCLKECGKQREECTNPNLEGHTCPKLCWESCVRCEILVMKARSICPHYFRVPCYQNVDELECTKPCKKDLPCGHVCKKTCSEPCGPCQIKVVKSIPDCKHKQTILCSSEPDRRNCQGKCPRIMSCGHVCDKRCKEDCNPLDCKKMVEVSIVAKCGHTIKQIPCCMNTLYKTAGKIDKLEEYCLEPCTSLLNCSEENKHVCTGSCGECFQGRIHKRCSEKCGQILVCNHECQVFCRETCKPCQRPCSFKCRHSACKKQCGEPCTLCKEPCLRNCQHKKCKNKCGQVCSVTPCDMPCEKTLKKCGHKCVGFCGDPCPPLCRVCDKEELEEFFFGTEDEEDARFVLLKDCGHVLEASGMEMWLKQDENQIKFKVCPKCKTTINTTERYSDYVKLAIEDVIRLKKRQYGSRNEIATKRQELLGKIMKFQKEIGEGVVTLRIPILNKTLNILKDRLFEMNTKGRIQPISLIGINSIEIKFELIEEFADVLKPVIRNFHEITKYSMNETIRKQSKFILKNLLRQLDDITNTEIEDIRREISRLARMVQLGRIILKSNITSQIGDQVETVLNQLNLFKYQDETVKQHLDELKKILGSSVSITEVERRQIVQAIGLKQGHWFKCPNGHMYAIGECGGAMEVSKCIECKAPIGGTSHQLLSTNMLAPEMDGARHPAWSDTANMANYVLQ
ncbi:hypothetical protein HHI36_020281 [Cryptolaemus montrouzieri]|uniref:RZ-type domain-containing protein n=1 Tax=Cryptolaemus montrouzieri TaxID=559131 RepID=A0ABD2NA53_9CUCU